MKRTIALLFAASCAQAVAAQPRPDEVAVHVAAPIYFEAERHVGGAVSWRRYSGDRSWGLQLEYDFAIDFGHADHIAWAGFAKSFGPPDDSVPYIVLGAAGVFCTTRYTGCRQVDFMPGIGVGLTEWSEDRRFFVAPEARFLIDANLKLSLAFGIALP